MHKSLENYLAADDGAGKLVAHASLLFKLAQIYQSIAPVHLRQASRLANYKSGIVVVHAASGAVAAKLRQMAPTLADAFSRRGIECTEVQIKVQAPETPQAFAAPSVKPLAPGACDALGSLRDRLPPDAPLRQAIAHLLERAAKR
ncbi:MAG: DciA family protein [Propionivibrio sp.]